MTKPTGKPKRNLAATTISPRYDPESRPAIPPLADFGPLPYNAVSAIERGILMAKPKPAKKPIKRGC